MFRLPFLLLALGVTALRASPVLTIGTDPAGVVAPLSLAADPAQPPPTIPYFVVRLAAGHPDETLLTVHKVTESGRVLLNRPTDDPFGESRETILGYRWTNGVFQPLHRSPNETAPYPYDWPPGFSFLKDMNDEGVVVGTYSHEDATDYYWVSSDLTYVASGCVWPADQIAPISLAPPSYPDFTGGYAPEFVADSGIVHGRMLNRGPSSAHSWGLNVIYQFGLNWPSHSSAPTLAGAAWPAGNVGAPQVARIVTATSRQGARTIGRETYQFFNGTGYPEYPPDRSDLWLIDGAPLLSPHTPVAINDHGRWVGHRVLPAATGWVQLAYWSDDRENPAPLESGSVHAINNAHAILGVASGIGRAIWKWEPKTGEENSAYHYRRYTVSAPPPDGWAIGGLARGFTDSGMFGGSLRRTHDEQGVPLAPEHQTTAPVLFVPGEMAVDANRDGSIMLAHGSVQSPDLTSEVVPFRFWSNDDDDEGDLANNDVPGQAPAANYGPIIAPGADWRTMFTNEGRVDGRTDLLDFFPVFLDIKQLLGVLPHTTAGITYKLKHADGALNFVYTNLTRSEAFHYLKHNQDREAYGNPGNEIYAHQATTLHISAAGAPLDADFLTRIKDEADKGVILIEGRQPTTAPLRLVVEKDGVEIAEVALHLKISPVEDFYRWINLRAVCDQDETRATNLNPPPAYPDSLTNGKMFIFVHGYNVNESQSRGWNAEAFKRMWHSGSKAMFTAVSWHGDHGQFGIPFTGNRVSLDYWDNIPNAFETAEALAPLVNSLPGSSKVIAGHSMGNIVVSSAIVDHGMSVTKYLMIDAAVALEAYDTSVSTTGPYFVNAMRPIAWEDYDRRLWSTDWWDRFPSDDNRRRLTWRNRFGDISNAINIYSSGEEVLNNNDLNPGHVPPLGTERIWIQQEMNKGGFGLIGTIAGIAAGEIQGGWDFNQHWGTQVWVPDPVTGGGSYVYVPPTLAQANALTDPQIREQPFFIRFDKASLMHADIGAGSSGSDAADEDAINDLLGGAIPALSFPAGRNPVPSFLTARNRDLMARQDGWPTGRPNNRWRHSDIRDVAYFFNYRAWDLFTDEGNLR